MTTRYWVDSTGQLHRTREICGLKGGQSFTVDWFVSPVDGWFCLDESADGAYKAKLPTTVAKRHGWTEVTEDVVRNVQWVFPLATDVKVSYDV